MLKHRVIQTLLYDGVQCVKPVAFQRPYRKLGSMEQYINVCERRNLDELIFIDIEATPNNRQPDYVKVRRFADALMCPLTVGGGVFAMDHISALLNNGADKVALHWSVLANPKLIEKAARKFGSQALVGCLNSKTVYDINWVCENGIISIAGFSARSYAKEMELLGIGEILLTDVDKDGVMNGYNIPLIKSVVSSVRIPVIANGGCGSPEHMKEAIDVGASAVAAGSMFLYTEETPRSCAKYLSEHGHEVRF